jgi:prepilin-type N-terminal cleavage/methylation domain-containing protein
MNRRHSRNSRRRRGFTLIEVLVSLTLFGIVVGMAMSGVDLATRGASLAKRQAEAATLGEAKLAEIVAQGDAIAAVIAGDFGADFPDYRWRLQTTQRDFDVTELNLIVAWFEQGQERTLNVSTLVHTATTTLGGLQ